MLPARAPPEWPRRAPLSERPRGRGRGGGGGQFRPASRGRGEGAHTGCSRSRLACACAKLLLGAGGKGGVVAVRFSEQFGLRRLAAHALAHFALLASQIRALHSNSVGQRGWGSHKPDCLVAGGGSGGQRSPAAPHQARTRASAQGPRGSGTMRMLARQGSGHGRARAGQAHT